MNIVHLEDEVPLQDVLKLALEIVFPEARIQQFVNSDRAYEYIAQNPDTINLFIFDIRVPGTMNGLQLAQRVRQLRASGGIMLTSAYTQPNAELLSLLSCTYITKPWRMEDFLNQVSSLADKV